MRRRSDAIDFLQACVGAAPPTEPPPPPRDVAELPSAQEEPAAPPPLPPNGLEESQSAEEALWPPPTAPAADEAVATPPESDAPELSGAAADFGGDDDALPPPDADDDVMTDAPAAPLDSGLAPPLPAEEDGDVAAPEPESGHDCRRDDTAAAPEGEAAPACLYDSWREMTSRLKDHRRFMQFVLCSSTAGTDEVGVLSLRAHNCNVHAC